MDLHQRNRTTRYLLDGVAVLVLAGLASLVLALALTRPPIQYNPDTAPELGTTVRARVLSVTDETQTLDPAGLVMVFQQLELRILTPGPYHDQIVTVSYNGMGPTLSAVRFREGARALVYITELPEGSQLSSDQESQSGQAPESAARVIYQVADHIRLLPLGLVAVAFAVVTVIIGRWQGVRALVGLALSALLIGAFIMPQILAHRDPVLVTLVGAALLLAGTLYLIQGWNPAGHAALLGVLISLAATGALAMLWTHLAFLTGFGSEETLFLQAVGVGVQMRGLLLAGMILGAAGVLDDVVIAQAVTVFELAAASPDRRFRTLYQRGMRVGVTHLASMVNTLVLAYASTALPLLILFYLYPEPWYLTINRELIAEEIVRALVGSLGLMLAVPLTTVIAAWIAPRSAD